LPREPGLTGHHVIGVDTFVNRQKKEGVAGEVAGAEQLDTNPPTRKIRGEYPALKPILKNTAGKGDQRLHKLAGTLGTEKKTKSQEKKDSW